MTKNFYELLGLRPGVSLTEIKRSYRKLARKYHPDSGNKEQSEELFHQITNAYDTLSNPEKRLKYDTQHGLLNAESHSESNGAPEQKHKQSEGREAYRKARPSAGSFGAADERLRSDAQGGPNSARFSGTTSSQPTEAEARDPGSSLIGKIARFVRSPGKPAQSAPSNKGANQERSRASADIRGPREYHFTIDALESIRGTTRELALRTDEGNPRVVRIKIPSGIRHGATLKVPISEGEAARIHVSVVPHAHVARDGDDVTVRVPLTLLEGLQGVDLEVPTPQGPVKVRIPPKGNDDKKLRLKGRGVRSEGAEAPGDLYVDTYIVLPTALSEVAKQAAQALEAHYNTDIRRDLPRQLN